ncbi:MAG: N-acetylglucosamine repressor [Candidatus Sumerlaeia bacterium]
MLGVLWRHGPVTRNFLASSLRLNPAIISSLVRSLQDRGLVVKIGNASSTGGRKADLIDVAPNLRTVIGVEFSSRGIFIASADLRGGLRHKSQASFSRSDSPDVLLDKISAMVGEQIRVLEEQGTPRERMLIGFALSGTVDQVNGVSVGFPRMEHWSNVPLRELIERRFGVRTTVGSHMHGATVAEHLFGNAQGATDALFVQAGPGIGLGMVLNGRVYRGFHGLGGEFGHTQMLDNGPLCYCGARGCLESLASDEAVLTRARKGLDNGVNSDLQVFNRRPGGLTPADVFEAARDGDRFALNIVEEVGYYLGVGIANLINLMAPEVIVLGGTMLSCSDLLQEVISRTVSSKVLRHLKDHVVIRSSAFGAEAGLRGAITLAALEFFDSEPGGQAAPGVLEKADIGGDERFAALRESEGTLAV